MTMSAATPRPLWGLLPVKHFARAKSRLAPVLGEAERIALARSLGQHVLSTLAGCAETDGVLVLSDSEEVRELTTEHGFVAEPEPEPRSDGSPLGLNTLVDHGLARLQERGAGAVLVLMSDLPRLQPDDLGQLVDALRQHDCVIAPDLRQQNTNALALRLAATPGPFQTAFGSGDSFARHLQRSRELGLRTAILRTPGLGFDLDLPSDYAELSERGDLRGRS